jgi:hypothetical protein
MIAKTTIGRSFKGCCGYTMQKVEQGKGQILLSQGVRDYETRAMVADFTRQAMMNPELSRSVWHTAISFDPQDEARLRQDSELMKAVATDYLKGMGLDQTQYVVIQHQDTPHAHFHIVANRVANDSHTVSDSHNYHRSQALLREIEQKHGLTLLVEANQRQRLERVPETDRQRVEMRNEVRQCVQQATNSTELQRLLADRGISLIVNRGKDGQARGLSFSRNGTDSAGELITVAFKGSKLHKDLSLQQIQQQVQQNAQKQAVERSKQEELAKAQNQQKTPRIEDNRPTRSRGHHL